MQFSFPAGSSTPDSGGYFHVTGALTWNANGSLGKLAITDPFNSANSQTCTYSHDDLARILSANCGSLWSDTFSYDTFGNITKAGTSQFQPLYYSATNQMMSIGSFTPSYDANGDVLNDNSHSYAWDVEGRPTTISGITVTYDALSRQVEQDNSGSYTETVYDPTGNRFATMKSATTLDDAYVLLPAEAQAIYTSQPGSLDFYKHPDWLGSARFLSTPNRAMEGDVAYGQYGEVYAATGASSYTFTGQNQEGSYNNLYRFMYREYGTQGRWPSPDPAGFAAANPANPQSWNRYAYVMNSPLNLTDPAGLQSMNCRNAAKPPCSNTPVGGTGWGCEIDGVSSLCSLTTGAADSQCPNNICSGVNAGGQYVQYTCTTEGCGYSSLTPIFRVVTVSVTGQVPLGVAVEDAPLQTALVQDYNPDLINGGYINNLPMDMYLTYGSMWGISDQITGEFNNMLTSCEAVNIMATEAFITGVPWVGPFAGTGTGDLLAATGGSASSATFLGGCQ